MELRTLNANIKRYVYLKNWFNKEYAKNEQKYRRLIALEKLCDDGQNPKDKLNELYLLAEQNRAEIQNLEVVLKGLKR